MTDIVQLRNDFRAMLEIRTFEERVRELRLAGDIVGSVHLCIGQEAGPVGAAGVLGEADALFATYRGHGWAIARGVPMEALFAELLGRASGINGGRAGSAYFTAPEYGFYGENSIVGAGAPIAVGAALAGRFDGTGRVAMTVFGDGAMNQGAVHEAMNFASAFALPVIFICENNEWSELTPIDAMVGDPELYKRAAAYGMEGTRIDGNDPAIVRSHLNGVVGQVRSGAGPVLVELMTARLVGHYIGDPEHYRRPGELDVARENEPLVRCRAALLSAGASESELDDIAAEVTAHVASASERALTAPLADPASAKEHIYA